MSRRSRFFLFGLLLCFLYGCTCGHSKWTEQQRRDFARSCAATDSTTGVVFFLSGFSYAQVQDIRVFRVHEGRVIDSFLMHADSFDTTRHTCSASFPQPLFIRDQYEFFIPGEDPYVLNNMKMVDWPQYTMTGEGHGCVMGDYLLDGKHFTHNANPSLVKRGFRMFGDAVADTTPLRYRLNDSVSYAVINFTEPNNAGERLVVYHRDDSVGAALLRNSPDQDFSIPHYAYTDYRSLDRGCFLVVYYEDRVRHPARVLTPDGQFREGANMETVETITDSVQVRCCVRADGRLQQDTLQRTGTSSARKRNKN